MPVKGGRKLRGGERWEDGEVKREGKREEERRGGGERRKDRGRESCNLYIKASIERVSAAVLRAKRARRRYTDRGINVYSSRVGVCAVVQQLARSV